MKNLTKKSLILDKFLTTLPDEVYSEVIAPAICSNRLEVTRLDDFIHYNSILNRIVKTDEVVVRVIVSLPSEGVNKTTLVTNRGNQYTIQDFILPNEQISSLMGEGVSIYKKEDLTKNDKGIVVHNVEYLDVNTILAINTKFKFNNELTPVEVVFTINVNSIFNTWRNALGLDND